MGEGSDSLLLSIGLAVAALVALCHIIRRDQFSLGLPLAYLGLLLLNHLPGAVAHLTADGSTAHEVLTPTQYTDTGMHLTAIAAACFVAGVAISQVDRHRATGGEYRIPTIFLSFCLYGGWLVTFVLLPFANIPSIGAAIDKAGALWILGVLLGLRGAVISGQRQRILFWLAAMLVYPILILLMSGFLSYGTAAVMIALSGVATVTRRISRVWISMAVIAVVGLSVFANYFVARDELRRVLWAETDWEERIQATVNAFADFEPLGLSNSKHLRALDERLNQNYFVGIAATRLDAEIVDYKRGWSLVEAAMSLVPRVIWPDKPVYGGSPAVVREMTGLDLSEQTSWGVGNVMEFYINFGYSGLAVGFVVLGMLLGRLDRIAALHLTHGNPAGAIICFLPAVALIQPIGSLVELASGSAAALVGAQAWKVVWHSYYSRSQTVVARDLPPGQRVGRRT